MIEITNEHYPQVILFDLDGTLVDSAFDLYRAMNLSLTRLGLETVTETQVREWIGKGSALFCQSTLAHVQGEVDPVLLQQLLATFLEIYNAEPCVNTQVFEGVIPFLQWCDARDITMLCVTNKPEQPAIAIVEALGVAPYMREVIGGDRFELRKPDPVQLQYCVERYASDVAACLMLGDSSNDVEAARRTGMDCIVLSYGYNHGEDIALCHPQRIVDNMMQIIGTGH